jgi:hypothetical protein
VAYYGQRSHNRSSTILIHIQNFSHRATGTSVPPEY